MSAVILEFPRSRAQRYELSFAATMRRVRFKAMVAGCTSREVRRVEEMAATMVDERRPAHEIIERAASLAAALVAERTPPGAA